MAEAVSSQAPSTVALIVDPEQKKKLRNTFICWEVATLALGIYIGKKVWEPPSK